MDTMGRFARRFRLLHLLQASLVAGALYDLGFACLMIVAPQFGAGLFDLPLPGQPFYLRLIAVFLIMLAALYLFAARNPRQHADIIRVAIVGRLAGAVALGVSVIENPELSGLWLLAAADLAFGLAHAAFWVPLRNP